MKRCWKCSTPWEYRHTPGTRDECEKCCAPLRCCRNCRFCKPEAKQWCNEPAARDERPRDAEEFNNCSFFVFREENEKKSVGNAQAREGLAKLFGSQPDTADSQTSGNQKEKPDWMKFDKPDLSSIFKPPDR